MRNHLILIICFLIFMQAITVDASSLYAIPVEMPSEEKALPWQAKVQGSGAELFSEAFNSYKQGQLNDALSRFKDLTNRYQKSEAAAVSTLYIGSIYLEMAMAGEKKDKQLLRNALESFQDNVRNYPDTNNTPAVIIEIGKTYREMALIEEAKGSFNRVIKEYSLSPYAAQAQYQLALTYEKGKEYREALAAYKILSVKYTGEMDKESIFGMGKALFNLHEFGESKRFYEEGLNRWPEYLKGQHEMLFNYSECQFQNGEFSKAREGFLIFYNLYPSHKDAGLALNRVGETYMLERKGSAAEKIFMDVVALFPKSEDALLSKLELGDLKIMSLSGDIFYQDALRYYKEVEESSVNEPYGLLARYKTGKVFEAQGKYQKSLSIYNELLKKAEGPLNKEVSRSFYNLTGNIGKHIEERLSHNDYLGALKIYHAGYKDYLDSIPEEKLLMKIADAHVRLLLYNEASYIYQKIISKNGAERELALYKSGELYSFTGDDTKVVETLGRYIADYPRGVRRIGARVLMGESLYNLRDYEKASGHFYSVMRDAPYQYPSVYIKLSNILLGSKQYQESANILMGLIKHLSGDRREDFLSVAYVSLGNSFYGLERYQEALDSYSAGLKKREIKDETETVQVMIGDCLLKLNKVDEAEKIFSVLSEKSAGIVKRISEERLKDIEFSSNL